MLQPSILKVPNLLDSPEVQKYLFGTDPMDNAGRNQTTMFDQIQNIQNQQDIPLNTLPAAPPSLVPAQDAVQPNVGQPTQYAFQQPPQNKITSILDLIRENKPVQDPTLDARYKKAAMLDSLGQAFGNLAGAVGVGMGATVPKLPVDNNIARLYGMRDAEKQRFLQQKRGWDAQMLQGAIQEMGMNAQARKDANAETWNKRDYAFKVKKADNDYTIALGKAKDQAERDRLTAKYRADKLAIDEKNAKTNAFRASQSGVKEDPTTRAQRLFLPYTSSLTGETKVLSEGDTRQAYLAAQKEAMKGGETSEWGGRMKALQTAIGTSDGNAVIKAVATDWLAYQENQAAKKVEADRVAKVVADRLKYANIDKIPASGIPFSPTSGSVLGQSATQVVPKAGGKSAFDKNKYLHK